MAGYSPLDILGGCPGGQLDRGVVAEHLTTDAETSPGDEGDDDSAQAS
jgi:hypothetical protein